MNIPLRLAVAVAWVATAPFIALLALNWVDVPGSRARRASRLGSRSVVGVQPIGSDHSTVIAITNGADSVRAET